MGKASLSLRLTFLLSLSLSLSQLHHFRSFTSHLRFQLPHPKPLPWTCSQSLDPNPSPPKSNPSLPTTSIPVSNSSFPSLLKVPNYGPESVWQLKKIWVWQNWCIGSKSGRWAHLVAPRAGSRACSPCCWFWWWPCCYSTSSWSHYDCCEFFFMGSVCYLREWPCL